ncbi:type VI secretion system tip protein VgrG [Xylophilus sp. Kf1]|nr:type VI secretion system tip protein VgrG [Xylophilus sp. Kf1]
MTDFRRPLEVVCPAIPLFLGRPALQPVRLSGTEGLDSLFCYELTLQTLDGMSLHAAGASGWSLDRFVGAGIQCRIQLDGAGRFEPGRAGPATDRIGAGVRQINAIVTRAETAGDDGRDLQYRLTLRPWLHLATLNCDCRVFQDVTVVDILDQLLAAYPFAVDKRLIASYPRRDFQVQFNESDFAFFSRLTQEYGIHFGFEHADDRHRLVLADHLGAYTTSPSAAYHEIDYRPEGWKAEAEYFHRFVPAHELVANRYSTSDHDYRQPLADLRQSCDSPAPPPSLPSSTSRDPQAYRPPRPLLEVYQWHHPLGGSHYAQPTAGSADAAANNARDEGAALAVVRLQALVSPATRATASGNLRGLVPGCTFRLNRHSHRAAEGEYLVLDSCFRIENPAYDSQPVHASAASPQDGGKRWRVHVDITAHPLTQPLRPVPRQPKPQAGGVQTALVVGPPGANVWTDDLGRIKLQFPWDRRGRRDEHSSCWVRVCSHWAGNQMGQFHIPRVGQEVMVAFIGGDPDLPVCIGSAFNPMNAPPWRQPGQAALSGVRSRELGHDRDGRGTGNSAHARSNHLVLDDTEGAIQLQIKSDHQHSQLSLGAIGRIEDHQGRKDARGEGYELRTDRHGVLRAGDGLLISTEKRPAARGRVKDMPETLERLKRAQEQHAALGTSARQARAQDAGEQESVADGLKSQNHEIRGEDKPSGELTRPHVVVASAAGIATSSAGPTHIAADADIALTSRADTSLSALGHLLASARESVRLFAFRAGMKLIAAAGDIDISALQHSVRVLARLDVRLEGDRIHLQGRQEIVINGGGSYLRLDAAGVTVGTAGTWKVRAGVHGGTEAHSQPLEPTPIPRPDIAVSASERRPHGMSV